MFKKIILSLLAFALLFHSFSLPVYAQNEQWYDSGILNWYVKVYDTKTSDPQEIFGERYTAAQVQWVLYSLIVIPMNMMFSSSFTACWLNAMATGSTMTVCFADPGFVKFIERIINVINAFKPAASINSGSDLASNNSKIGTFTKLVFADRQLSGITYIKNVVKKVQLVPVANAATGFGYGALQILQTLWGKSRDISYSLLIFAAIIMAFMIMFRTKVSPQAVITVQSAVPKLIMAIILITFSYAIAGLLIDVMYVVIGLIATVLSDDPTKVPNLYSFLVDGPGGGGVFSMMVTYSVFAPAFIFVAIAPDANGPIQQFISTNIFGQIVFIIAFGLMAIILAFAFLRIIFMFIKTLISIYLLTIFGPFYILGGAVISSLSFGNWLKEFAANLAVFPVTGILFTFSLLFLQAAGKTGNFSSLPIGMQNSINTFFDTLGIPKIIDAASGNVWIPPLMNFGAGNGGLLLVFVSIGIVLMMPKIADIIKSFMTGRPFAYGSAIGEAVTGAAVGTAALSALPGKAYDATNKRLQGIRGFFQQGGGAGKGKKP